MAALERSRANLKRYRAAVLKAACEGGIVPTEAEFARVEGRTFETASELSERVAKERYAELIDFQKDQCADGGMMPIEGGWKSKYELPNTPAPIGVVVPNGWCVTSLEALTSAVRTIRYGILMPKEHVPDGVLYVKVKDMKGDRIGIDGLQRTKPEIAAQYAKASLRPGDLLLAIRGTYGRVAEVPPVLDGGNITQDTARLAVSNLVDRRYIAIYLRSDLSQGYFNRVARGWRSKVSISRMSG